MRGRVLEAILKAERELASCGRGSQPRTREVRKPPVGHYDPTARVSLEASAQMPEREACGPGTESANVERRAGECTVAGARRASPARQFFAPPGAPPPLDRDGKRKQNPGRRCAAGAKGFVPMERADQHYPTPFRLLQAARVEIKTPAAGAATILPRCVRRAPCSSARRWGKCRAARTACRRR
jgi:hypothetical protein